MSKPFDIRYHFFSASSERLLFMLAEDAYLMPEEIACKWQFRMCRSTYTLLTATAYHHSCWAPTTVNHRCIHISIIIRLSWLWRVALFGTGNSTTGNGSEIAHACWSSAGLTSTPSRRSSLLIFVAYDWLVGFLFSLFYFYVFWFGCFPCLSPPSTSSFARTMLLLGI